MTQGHDSRNVVIFGESVEYKQTGRTHQSFKHFKDGFFKAVVKEAGRSHFYNDDRSTKFPFSWTDNP